MSFFKSKKIKGVVYDIAHLAPTEFQFIENGNKFVVHATFSCHCFTETFRVDVHTPDFYYVHGNEKRAFSVARYELSKQLPALITSLGARTVYHSNIGNYFILHQSVGTSYQGKYVAFFNVTRADRNKKFDIIMHIQSAYLKPNIADRASPIKFGTLLDFTVKGKKPPLGERKSIKRK